MEDICWRRRAESAWKENMGKMGKAWEKHGKSIVDAGRLNLHRSRFMGKMGEMGVDVRKSLGFLCVGRGI